MRRPTSKKLYKSLPDESVSNGTDTPPRQDPHADITSFPEVNEGPKRRIRAESFAGHFSQARQFFYSQAEPEQDHIVSAFIFELSQVQTKAVPERMAGQLANVDPKIAERVSNGLGLKQPVAPVPAAVKVHTIY